MKFLSKLRIGEKVVILIGLFILSPLIKELYKITNISFLYAFNIIYIIFLVLCSCAIVYFEIKKRTYPKPESIKLDKYMHQNGHDFELRYNYSGVTVISTQIQSTKPGDTLHIVKSPTDASASGVIALINQDSLIVAYLYPGKLQDMSNDFLKKQLPIIAIAENSPLSSIKLGFYDISRSEKNKSRLESGKEFEVYKLSNNLTSDIQENLELMSIYDPIKIIYDKERQRFAAIEADHQLELGSFQSNKLDINLDYEGCIYSKIQDHDFKFIIEIAII